MIKDDVTEEVGALARKTDRAVHRNAYTALGFIFCVGLILGIVFSRPGALVEK